MLSGFVSWQVFMFMQNATWKDFRLGLDACVWCLPMGTFDVHQVWVFLWYMWVPKYEGRQLHYSIYEREKSYQSKHSKLADYQFPIGLGCDGQSSSHNRTILNWQKSSLVYVYLQKLKWLVLGSVCRTMWNPCINTIPEIKWWFDSGFLITLQCAFPNICSFLSR